MLFPFLLLQQKMKTRLREAKPSADRFQKGQGEKRLFGMWTLKPNWAKAQMDKNKRDGERGRKWRRNPNWEEGKIGEEGGGPKFYCAPQNDGMHKKDGQKKEEAEKEDDADADGRMTLRRRRRKGGCLWAWEEWENLTKNLREKLGSNDVKPNIPSSSCV
jgi:hypothetical protein